MTMKVHAISRTSCHRHRLRQCPSNPGLVLLKKGTILMKWHYNDIPQEEDLKTIVNGYLEGNTDWKAKEDARLITNLLSFTVPLLLVWGYDALRNRRRRKGKESE